MSGTKNWNPKWFFQKSQTCKFWDVSRNLFCWSTSFPIMEDNLRLLPSNHQIIVCQHDQSQNFLILKWNSGSYLQCLKHVFKLRVTISSRFLLVHLEPHMTTVPTFPFPPSKQSFAPGWQDWWRRRAQQVRCSCRWVQRENHVVPLLMIPLRVRKFKNRSP